MSKLVCLAVLCLLGTHSVWAFHKGSNSPVRVLRDATVKARSNRIGADGAVVNSPNTAAIEITDNRESQHNMEMEDSDKATAVEAESLEDTATDPDPASAATPSTAPSSAPSPAPISEARVGLHPQIEFEDDEPSTVATPSPSAASPSPAAAAAPASASAKKMIVPQSSEPGMPTVAAGSDTVFVPASHTEETIAPTQSVPVSIASVLASKSAVTPIRAPDSAVPSTTNDATIVFKPPTPSPTDAPILSVPSSASLAQAQALAQAHGRAGNGNGDAKALMASKLAEAMQLAQSRHAYEATLQAQNPEAARAYLQWQAQQQQEAQHEQLETQRQLKEQVMALQQQLESTQSLLKLNADKADAAEAAAAAAAQAQAKAKADAELAAAAAAAEKARMPAAVPGLIPSQYSGQSSRELNDGANSLAQSSEQLPKSVVGAPGGANPYPKYFENLKSIQPHPNNVSVFFFSQGYCSGDFQWYYPPTAAMVWSVGSWMAQENSGGGPVKSVMLCNNFGTNGGHAAAYQRMFQLTVWRNRQFESDSADFTFYAHPGQCICAIQPIVENAYLHELGSWKLAQI